MNLNKEFIISLDNFEMTHVQGGGIKGWIMGAVSVAVGVVTLGATPTTAVGGTLCVTVAEGGLSELGCNSSICGS